VCIDLELDLDLDLDLRSENQVTGRLIYGKASNLVVLVDMGG
jgi:hypothetical protein